MSTEFLEQLCYEADDKEFDKYFVKAVKVERRIKRDFINIQPPKITLTASYVALDYLIDNVNVPASILFSCAT